MSPSMREIRSKERGTSEGGSPKRHEKRRALFAYQRMARPISLREDVLMKENLSTGCQRADERKNLSDHWKVVPISSMYEGERTAGREKTNFNKAEKPLRGFAHKRGIRGSHAAAKCRTDPAARGGRGARKRGTQVPKDMLGKSRWKLETGREGESATKGENAK